jgi:hypothetical protein
MLLLKHYEKAFCIKRQNAAQMRIWKLFQKHYEQGVLHKAAKCCANENLEIISKAL